MLENIIIDIVTAFSYPRFSDQLKINFTRLHKTDDYMDGEKDVTLSWNLPLLWQDFINLSRI